MSLHAGTRLGPYEVLALIGSGGMGEVYKARDTRLGRLVAIKVLPERFAQNVERRQRFEREARAISQLNHPYICTLFDVHFRELADSGDRDYMVLELVTGETLQERLARGPLSGVEAKNVAIAIAEALAEAHRRGILHRDLKPANVMFTDRGDVKVMDFGLAASLPNGERVASEAPTVSGRMTREGAPVGTPAYMSPEQILGGAIDVRSDLFSFGILLHEMLTGSHPFGRQSPSEIMAAILREPPAIDSGLGPPFVELVTRLTAKKPEERLDAFEDVLKHLASQDGRVSGALAPKRQAARIRIERDRLVGERRTVTVLVGSVSPPNDGRDEEELVDSLQPAVTTMESIVERYEGTRVERRHDGVVAVFGAPLAQEDAARWAVSAAMEMKANIEGFRAGLHTGPVIVDRVQDDLEVSLTPLGDTLRVASRLEAQADVGHVLMSERTRLGARDFFEHEALPSAGAEDFAYKVIRQKAATARPELDSARTPFYGRARELAALDAAYQSARNGEGQIVLLSGPAGIGKSRLLSELRKSLSDLDIGWLSGNCSALGAGTPYFAVTELLKSAFSIDESDADADILQRIDEQTAQWEERARHQIAFLEHLLNVDSGRLDFASMDPAELRLEIHHGVAALFQELSRTRPLVVALEDLHWMDRPSEQALAENADLVGSLPLLLVLTHRPGHEPLFGERSFVHRLSLGHLGVEDARALVLGILGTETLPRELERLVSEKSGGNPFFAEEITRSLLESGELIRTESGYALERTLDEIRVPDRIQDVILARIDRLPAEARQTLQLASVIGREFAHRLLQRISESDVRLDDALGELKGLELLREKARFPELSYLFQHALVHEVAYATLLRQRRRELHGLVAEAIEALYSDRLAEHYEMLAYHGVESENWQLALDYFERAAEKAARSASNDEALEFYDRAIELGENIGETARPKRIELSRRRSELLVFLLRLTEAFDEIARMKALARDAADRHHEAMALALEGWARGFDYDIDRMERVSKEALRLAEDDDHEVRFFASLTLSFFLYAFHRVEEARPYLELAEKLAPLARNLFRQAWWGIVGWHQLNWEGRYDEVLDHLEHWKSPAEKSGSLFVVVGLRWEEAVALGGKGDYQRALSLAREVLATSERIGYDYFRIRAVNVVGWIYGELQDHERAAEWNRRGVEVAIEAAEVHPEVECNARVNLGDDLMALGRLDEAAAEFRVVEAIVRDPRPEQRLDLWRYAQHLYHSYGALWLLRGDAKRAIELADECIAIAEPANHRKNVVKGRRLRGEAFLSIGDLESAESELTKALDIAKAVGNPPQLWKTFAAMGELRERQGRTDEARACYREALAVIGRVADALEEDELRDTFLGSDHVQSIRARASA